MGKEKDRVGGKRGQKRDGGRKTSCSRLSSWFKVMAQTDGHRKGKSQAADSSLQFAVPTAANKSPPPAPSLNLHCTRGEQPVSVSSLAGVLLLKAAIELASGENTGLLIKRRRNNY
ncbi:hypothetical protein ABVT39_013159 [Epinephelus coioides]